MNPDLPSIPAGYRTATAHDLAFLPRGSMWWCPKRKSWERSLKATATQGRIYCVPVSQDSQESTSMPVTAQNTPQNRSESVPSIKTLKPEEIARNAFIEAARQLSISGHAYRNARKRYLETIIPTIKESERDAWICAFLNDPEGTALRHEH